MDLNPRLEGPITFGDIQAPEGVHNLETRDLGGRHRGVESELGVAPRRRGEGSELDPRFIGDVELPFRSGGSSLGTHVSLHTQFKGEGLGFRV